MRWKVSVDLSRSLVSSMGQHDPLDGFVTCEKLSVTSALLRAKNAKDRRIVVKAKNSAYRVRSRQSR